MEFDSTKRFDRIVAIFIQLQSKRVIKAQELADRFDVSLRTIYRDLKSLENAGVPIGGEPGIGYSLVDGYRLAPVMFSREEASSFIAAEKLMQQFPDRNIGRQFESAMFKVKSVLRGSEKDFIEALSPHISVEPAQKPAQILPSLFERIFESLTTHKQVTITYKTPEADHPSVRDLEPVGIFQENGFWYLLGYCHLREDYRQFRLDRIQTIQRTEKPFTRKHGTVNEHRKQFDQAAKTKVSILVDRTVLRYLRYDRHYYGFISEEPRGEKVQLNFLTTDLEDGFARWYLMFGDFAEIIEPPSLIKRIREIAEKTLQNVGRQPLKENAQTF